jgi:hypothetical protein
LQRLEQGRLKSGGLVTPSAKLEPRLVAFRVDQLNLGKNESFIVSQPSAALYRSVDAESQDLKVLRMIGKTFGPRQAATCLL